MVQQYHPHQQAIVEVLSRIVSPITAASICAAALRQGSQARSSAAQSNTALLAAIARGLGVFCRDARARDECVMQIRDVLKSQPHRPNRDPVMVVINAEDDIVTARQAARTMAARLGFNETDQAKITTAVSELARNIHRYAGAGTVQLSPLCEPIPGIQVIAKDYGPGIPDITSVLSGQYKSKTGLGLGILGCKRLADEFAVETGPKRGTEIRLSMYLRKAA